MDRTDYHVEIPSKELRVIQMDILQAVDEFCRKKGIRYSLSCGSLLGAVRHKGYIPWDDDIDIYILRRDYDKLMSDFPRVFRNKYKIISLERSPIWDRPYAKAYDACTILKEDAYCLEGIGVNIDIYPIDDVPDDEKQWRSYDKKRRKWQYYYGLTSVKRGKNLLKTLVLNIIHLSTFVFSRRRIAQYLNKMAQKFNDKGCHRCFENVQGVLQRHPFEKALFDDIVPYVFEDRLFMGFSDADSYLSNAYGNYMQLPPESERVTHHSFTAFWK